MDAAALVPRYTQITATDHGPYVVIITVLMMVWAVAVWGMRIYVRFTFNGPFGLDDYAVSFATLVGMVQGAAIFVEIHDGVGVAGLVGSQLVIAQKAAYVNDIFFIFAMALSQISAFMLLSRLTRDIPHLQALNTLSVLTGLWAIGGILVVSLRCDLASPWVIDDETCGKSAAIRWMVVGGLSGLTEVAILIYPVIIVWTLQMRLYMKFIVVTSFSLRSPVLAALILRLYYLYFAFTSSDYTFALATPTMIGELQIFGSLIAATIPCLRPFLKAFHSGFMGVAAAQTDNVAFSYDGSRKGPGSSYGMSSRSKSRQEKSVNPSERTAGKDWKHAQTQTHIVSDRDLETISRTTDRSDEMIIRQQVEWNIQFEGSRAASAKGDEQRHGHGHAHTHGQESEYERVS